MWYYTHEFCTWPEGATNLTVWPAMVVATLSPGGVTKALGCTTFTVVGVAAAPVLVVIFWVAAAAAARAAMPVMPLWEVVVVVAGRRICVVWPPAPISLIWPAPGARTRTMLPPAAPKGKRKHTHKKGKYDWVKTSKGWWLRQAPSCKDKLFKAKKKLLVWWKNWAPSPPWVPTSDCLRWGRCEGGGGPRGGWPQHGLGESNGLADRDARGGRGAGGGGGSWCSGGWSWNIIFLYLWT